MVSWSLGLVVGMGLSDEHVKRAFFICPPNNHDRNAWKALAGMNAVTAMQRYVDRVTEWFPAASAAVPSGETAAAAASSERGGGEGDLRFGGATVSTMGAIGLDGRCVSWYGSD